jgi:hypothetical protein
MELVRLAESHGLAAAQALLGAIGRRLGPVAPARRVAVAEAKVK